MIVILYYLAVHDVNEVWYNSVLHVFSFICGHKKYNLHASTRLAFLEIPPIVHMSKLSLRSLYLLLICQMIWM